MMPRALLLGATALLFAVPLRAVAADGRKACFDAYVQAQRLRRDDKLRASREQLRTCASASCPAFVKNDCRAWLGEVEASLPSVVFEAQSDPQAEGSAPPTVFIDGERAAEAIGGPPISLDPGPHDIRYERDGRTVETHVLVPRGEKRFPIVLDLRALAPAPAPPSTPPPAVPVEPAADSVHASPPPHLSWLVRLPLATYALGGAALGGFAVFGGFAIAGKSATSCAPLCSHNQVGVVRTDYTIADVALGVAIAASAGAVTFALTAKPDPAARGAAQAPAVAWWLGVRPAAGGASVATGATF
jgi:hypothetical protein